MLTLNLTENDINNIARMASAEAASQGPKGMKAVTAVLLNRVASGEFGRNVTTVLTAEGQFDPVRGQSDAARKTKLASLPLTQDAKDVVRSYLESGVQDPTHGATFFRAPYAKNKFNDPKTATLVVEGKNTRRDRKGNLVGDAHLFFDHYGKKKYDVPAFAVKFPGMTQMAQFGGTTGEAPTMLANAGDAIRETAHDVRRDTVRAGKKVVKTAKDIAVRSAQMQNAPVKTAEARKAPAARRRELAEMNAKKKPPVRVAAKRKPSRYAARKSAKPRYAAKSHHHKTYSSREQMAKKPQFTSLADAIRDFFNPPKQKQASRRPAKTPLDIANGPSYG